jgi:membrane protease YdiL (CAAX protease family)
LYILIKKSGVVKGLILSAIAFGIYHWFSFGIIGNVMQMIVVFFITGAMGLLLAYAYAKTWSLYIPIAIHFGWNLTQIFIFSQGPIGNGILIPNGNRQFLTNSYLVFFAVTFLPMIGMLLVNYLLLRKRKQSIDL